MGFDRSGTGLAPLVAIRLISCVGVELELPLLSHFIRHYRDLGIPLSHMHILLNTADIASPRLAAAKALLADLGVEDVREWIADYTSDTMWAQRRQLQQDVAEPGDWIVSADVDEHHQYPAPLQEICEYCLSNGYNCVQGFMIDRLAANGELAEVNATPELSSQFPVEADVLLTLAGRGDHHGIDGTTKVMLLCHDVLPSRGGHNPWKDGKTPQFLAGAKLAKFRQATRPHSRFSYPFRVDHYNWTANRKTTLEKRVASPDVSPAGRELSNKLIPYLQKHGRVRLEDVATRRASAARHSNWRLLSVQYRLHARLLSLLKRLRLR
ncbi:MAG: hypothetical protein ACTHWH_16450 [Marinobacter sp.]